MKNLNKLKIKTRLIVLFIAILTLVSISISYLFHHRTSSLVLELSLNKLQHSTNEVTIQLTEKTNQLLAETIAFTQLPPIPAIAKGLVVTDSTVKAPAIWKKRLETIWQGYMKTNALYSQIRFISRYQHGQELVRVERQKNDVIIAVDQQNLQQKGQRNLCTTSLNVE